MILLFGIRKYMHLKCSMGVKRAFTFSRSLGASSSAVDADNESDKSDQKERRAQTTDASVAFLSHNKSLRSVFERFGEENVLSDWSEEDCAGLLIQLLKNFCDEDGAKRIVSCFRDTSVDEIITCFNLCKDLNKSATKERARMDNCSNCAPLSLQDTPTYPSWSSLLTQAKKSRGIADDSSTAIAKLLTEIATEYKDDDRNAAMDSPNYKFIYDHLASLVRGYSMRDVRSIDAAVILEIFESMESVIGSMPKLLSFFSQMFKDVQNFPKDEFKLGEEMDEENSGRLLTNILELPDNFFDLSSEYRDNSNK